jgi:hypothetical protein
MMTSPARALGPQRGQVDRSHNDLLTRTWIGLGEDAAVVIAIMLPPGQENGG